ncbi:MAG: hypothetical protein J6R18_03755 [Kiritimatiellae bacterium]|nr:hypothetical protein [Kiritimatiellia bacterium]
MRRKLHGLTPPGIFRRFASTAYGTLTSYTWHFPYWEHSWGGTVHIQTSTQDGSVEQGKKLSI